jgi:hypothetical protein
MHSFVPFRLLLGFSPSIGFYNIQMALGFEMFHLVPLPSYLVFFQDALFQDALNKDVYHIEALMRLKDLNMIFGIFY